ncbi:biliverdin-producing heme oxygenase [Pseudomonas caspiana]|nr:biliverdin-producing heme oxygenase [Pseudomonas caspiana]TPG90015.1 biliverdin-producing heme oxygenase [Pseudomonas caspiana]
MTTEQTVQRPALRSHRINQVAHSPHTKLNALIKTHEPFKNRANFARFAVAQYLFHSEMLPLYNDPELTAIIPDLPTRCRAQAAKSDLADLETEMPQPVPDAIKNLTKAEALGWLFVSEGSKFGAAIMIKYAVALGLSETFGARHLADPGNSCAQDWNHFIRTLDELEFNVEAEAEVDKGVVDAFNRFVLLLDQAYTLPADAFCLRRSATRDGETPASFASTPSDTTPSRCL